jgi:diguanylate cyclase (GGDEF)-like protein
LGARAALAILALGAMSVPGEEGTTPMFGSAAFASTQESGELSPARNAAITQELNTAAMDGDDERVKRLLFQLLKTPSRSTEERIWQQVAAIEDLFYAMRNLAVTDDLTGVYNRRGFEWVASRLLRNLSRERRGALLLYVDVDNLKITNDTLGHACGDRLLVAASNALRQACGESAIIGRIGGDEFAIVSRQFGSDTHSLLRHRIDDAIELCNATGQYPPLSLSIGAADYDPLRPVSILALMERADRAMYLEKFRPASPTLASTTGETA